MWQQTTRDAPLEFFTGLLSSNSEKHNSALCMLSPAKMGNQHELLLGCIRSKSWRRDFCLQFLEVRGTWHPHWLGYCLLLQTILYDVSCSNSISRLGIARFSVVVRLAEKDLQRDKNCRSALGITLSFF